MPISDQDASSSHAPVERDSDPSAANPPRPGKRVDTELELTFPASDSPAFTPEGGVRMDVEPLRQLPECSMAVRRFVVDGLLAAWQREAAVQSWLPLLGNAASLPLQPVLAGLLPGVERRLEWPQRALACFGVSHDAPDSALPVLATVAALRDAGGPLFDLAAFVLARTDADAGLSTYATVEQVAQAARLSEVADHLQRCIADARDGMDALAQAGPGPLVPAAVSAGGELLPSGLAQRVFGPLPGNA